MQATTAALAYLDDVIQRVKGMMGDSMCFRVVPTDNGQLGLNHSTPNQDDVIFNHGERPVLVVGPDIAPQLENQLLDLKMAEDGTRSLLMVETDPPQYQDS